jgi:hypothetical protein
MSNLVAVQRVDKNGVTNTKHVRVDPKKAAARNKMPAPAVAKQVETPAASAVQKRWRVNTKHWVGDEELEYLCKERFTAAQTYERSDAEAYDVLSVVSPRNVLPLLAVGMRSGEQAREFLEQTGLGRLITENESMAAEAVVRGFGALDFVTFAGEYEFSHLDTFMDVAEVAMDKRLASASQQRAEFGLKPLTDLVRDGEVLISDIKEMGNDFVSDYCTHFDNTFGHLQLMNAGKTAYKTATELKQVVMNTRIDAELTSAQALNVAAVTGVDIPASIHRSNIRLVEPLAIALRVAGKDVEESKAIIQYRLKVGALVDPAEQYISLYEAGISPEEATEGFRNELHATSIIAIRDGVVGRNLADGVL